MIYIGIILFILVHLIYLHQGCHGWSVAFLLKNFKFAEFELGLSCRTDIYDYDWADVFVIGLFFLSFEFSFYKDFPIS